MEDLAPQIPQPVPAQPAPVVQPMAAPVQAVPVESTQPVFYSLSPEEESAKPTPLYKRRQIMVIGLVALGFMIVVGLVIVFAVNAMRTASTAKKAEEQKASALQNMVENGSTQTAASRQLGFVDGCKGLDDGAYDNCVSLIALDKVDVTICDAITGDGKQACVDGVLLLKAKADKKYSVCDSIGDATTKDSCHAVLGSMAALAGDCTGYGAPQEYCDSQKALDAAVATGDPASCNSLPQEQKDSCVDIFTSTDEDKDGLTLAQEHQYGTSDKNPDTDGDGYTDGDEVATGHDPLKK